MNPLDDAYSLVSRDYRLEVPLEAFRSQVAPYRGATVEIGEAAADRDFPDAQDVLVTVTRPDGTRAELLYVLIREDGRWRIRGQEARGR